MDWQYQSDEVMSETEQIVEAKWDYQARQAEELNIKRSEKLILLDDSKSWWQVKKTNGEVGYVPSNFVKKVKPGFGSKIVSSIIKPKVKKPSVGENSRRPVSPMNPHERTPTSDNADGDDTFELRIAAVVKFNYSARQEDELSLRKGEKIVVQEKSSDGWWRGECDGLSGWFPSNYVTEEPDSASGSQKSSVSSRGEDSVAVEDFIHGVITLYPFTGRNDEELNFEQGERLDIVEIPENDPEWWKARNKNGEIGLVPKNYVQVLDNATPFAGGKSYPGDMHNNHHSSDGMMGGGAGMMINDVPIEQKDWFHGRITRDESERILQDAHEDGIFLIRESETAPGDYSVSVKAPGRIKHFKVKNNQAQYCIGTRQFDTLDDLVDHYKRAPIFSSTNGSFKLYLTRPFNNGH
ncbi:SH2/SH3 adapter protein NCK1-like isoform X2 [Amphiura filiformis]|uniref:SH2/SH3 adapter protein NCK1-like isoform X2 n=1 Tax=Amphiura filiformis TaxID=82378 RepID=UPI003B20DF0D